MKLVRFKSNAPHVVILMGAQGAPREIINPDDPAVNFYVSDVEFTNANRYFDIVIKDDIAPGIPALSGDLTDDRTDQYSGEIESQADADSVDGYKWYQVEFSTTRRTISAMTKDHDYWFTFEDPYIMDHATYITGGLATGGNALSPRTPAIWDITSGKEAPYPDNTDPLLVDQPFDLAQAAGPDIGKVYEYSWPKASRVQSGFTLEIEFPLYENWARNAWVRPVSTTITDKAKIYIYAY